MSFSSPNPLKAADEALLLEFRVAGLRGQACSFDSAVTGISYLSHKTLRI